MMSNLLKEEGEKSGMEKDCSDLKMEHHIHGFKLQYKSVTYNVTCNAATTLLGRLQNHFYFKAICKKKQNNQELVLLIQRDRIAKVALNLDTPCYLIQDNELLDIKFIPPEKQSSPKSKVKPTKQPIMNNPETLVSFYVKTKGNERIRALMKNMNLYKKADYVCVFAYIGEKVKTALKRDGRFKNVVFQKAELFEEREKTITGLTDLVDRLDGKQFLVSINRYQTGNQESSQESSQETKLELNQEPSEQCETVTNEIPGSSQSEQNGHKSMRDQEVKAEMSSKEKKTIKYPNVETIQDTKEILQLLRDQFGRLLKTLKERENLKAKPDLQRFYRQEFDKSAESFSEIKRMRELIFLSDSVCQIRVCDSPKGTGFILFGRFVITNAHVVEMFYDRTTKEPTSRMTAVFGYEDQKTGDEVQIKRVVVCAKGMDENKYLDFALLELNLSDDQKLPFPELLKYYSAQPSRGPICIIGHPEGNIKKMDHSFIIPKADVPNNIDNHVAMNHEYLFVMTLRAMDAKRELSDDPLYYNSCFFHGSSGSPVFDEFCHLIGVHTAGYVYKGNQDKTRSIVEYALPLFPILVHICKLCYINNDTEKLRYFQSQTNLSFVLKTAAERAEKFKEDSKI